MRRSLHTAITLCFLVCTRAAAQSGQALPATTYTRAQRLVAVEGKRHLNVFCIGRGAPTVWLDAGAGENMMVWRHVQRQIASTTRVCAYDRAGYGFSDSTTRASDARNAVRDLHRLIQADLSGPVVYVGHSISGMYGALLVSTHPRDVAGLVLVDPAFAHSLEATTASYTKAERAQMSGMLMQTLSQLRTCLTLARTGALAKPTTAVAERCVETRGYAEPLDDTLRHELKRQYAQPKLYAAALSEYSSYWPATGAMHSVDDRQLDSAAIDFGDRPLVVLTRGRPQPSLPGIAPAHVTHSDAAWTAGHEAFAQKSKRGTHLVVPNAGHHIQFDQPATVIDAVRRVVADVRRFALPTKPVRSPGRQK